MTSNSAFPDSDGLTVGELAEKCGLTLMQDELADTIIRRIAPISRAGSEEITFIKSRKALKELENSSASAVICDLPMYAHVPEGVAGLVTSHPESAFAAVAALLYPDAMRPLPNTSERGISAKAHIDPSARLEDGIIVEAGAVIGADVEIGSGSIISANSVIGRGTRIGRDCTICAHVSVSHAIIGNRVILHPGARIGQDGFGYSPGPKGLQKIPQVGRVVIQDDVEIGANACVDRGAMDDTVIGEGTKIDNMVQIAHNVKVGRSSAFAALVGVAGSTTIGNFVMIGGGSGINGHVSVGDGVVLGGLSGVYGDVPPGVHWGGVPARPLLGVIRDGVEAIARANKRRTGKIDEAEK